MKKILLALLIGFGAYQAWERRSPELTPLYDEPYVAVYGRDRCGWTQKMLRGLDDAGIDYEYFSVDERSVSDDLHARMRQDGLQTRRYNLPVVDVSGRMSVRPDLGTVSRRYYEGG